MANKTYVGIVEGNQIRFVTGFDPATHTAVWDYCKNAKPIAKKTAEDIAFGLRMNGYPAVLITAPDHHRFYNEGRWFGEVRWCEEDIRCAMCDCGRADDPDDVDEDELAKVTTYVSRGHALHDAMVEQGWETIHYLVRSYYWEQEALARRAREEGVANG